MSVFSKIKSYFKKEEETLKTYDFIWKYMDIDQNLIDEIKDIYSKNIKKDLTGSRSRSFQTLPIKVPDIMGQKVNQCSLVYSTARFNDNHCHKDPHPYSIYDSDMKSQLALNIPFKNCENSETKFYRDSRKNKHVFIGDMLPEIAPLDEANKISSYVLDRPILFETQILHAVFNNSDQPRVAISLRFEKNPVQWINVCGTQL
jgi:hypothetical protein